MRREKIIDLQSVKVRVREITVGELRNLLSQKSLELDPLGFLRGEGKGISDEVLQAFTDLEPEALETLTFSELRAVLDGVREVNSDFFELLKMLGMAQGILGEMSAISTESSAP